jgi:PAS domain S-box-containing protein
MLLDRPGEFCYEVKIDGDPSREVVTFVSPSWERVTGCAAQQLVTDPFSWRRLIHVHDLQRMLVQTEAILASRRAGTRRYRLRASDGHYRDIEDRVVPTLDAAGQVVGYQGVARDVTPGADVGQRERGAGDDSENAGRAATFERLASDTAHRISNVLTVVLGRADAARLHLAPTDPAAVELRRIDDAVERGARLLQTLLTHSDEASGGVDRIVEENLGFRCLADEVRGGGTVSVSLRRCPWPSGLCARIRPAPVEAGTDA